MTRKPETIAFWRGRLPHWEVEDGRYFVTLHLAGAIPRIGEERIHTLSADLQKLAQTDHDGRYKLQRRIFATMEEWLDRAEHAVWLKEPRVAQMIMEAIAFREGRDWRMFEFVVMPNHVHLFFELLRTTSSNGDVGALKSVLEQFKRWTGHEAAKLLGLHAERVWQDEWFDHWSRSDEEDERIMAYIRENPKKAGLVDQYLKWPYGSWRFQ